MKDKLEREVDEIKKEVDKMFDPKNIERQINNFLKGYESYKASKKQKEKYHV